MEHTGLLFPRADHEEAHDIQAVREFVALATAEGLRPSSIDQGRLVLLRYDRFLRERFDFGLNSARWQEFAAYKGYLAETGVSKATIRGYLSYVLSFYRLKAQATQDPQILELFTKVKAIGMPRKAKSEKWKPFSTEMLVRILEAAKAHLVIIGEAIAVPSEDYVFLMTLLYTGGRAQFYGLRIREVDFDRMEISAVVKGGKRATIPLHPKLSEVLKEHLAHRNYQSEFLFHHGHDSSQRTGQKANRQNAWRACKRVQRLAGLEESVHPHRFRKTLATIGKRLGMDPQFLQTILAHESVTMTLDKYAEVELDDVKREFAKLDLCGGLPASAPSIALETIDSLKQRAPAGKEAAWNMILEGLLSLLGGDRS